MSATGEWNWRRVGLALFLGASLAVLAACEKPPLEECEEGVGDLSRTADLTPPGC
jgi:hypothetical protein